MDGHQVRETPRILVYGSCVSRDTLEYMPKPVTIVKYIARQSLISNGNQAAPSAATVPTLDSSFQRRVTDDDRLGNAVMSIASLAGETDLLLIDFTDERGGVYHLGGGTFMTRSVERVAHGADTAFSDRIAFGTPEHLVLWTGAFQRLVATLRASGLLSRTIALALPWARETVMGDPTPESFGMSADQANRLFRPYYRLLRRSPIRVIRPVPWRRLMADPEHRWGLAPFHYTQDVYRSVSGKLEAHLHSLDVARQIK